MSIWSNYLKQANEALQLGITFTESMEGRGMLTDELRAIFDAASEAAFKSPDKNMLRFASGAALKTLREQVFPKMETKYVASLLSMRHSDLEDIEGDKRLLPHARSAYAKNLLAAQEEAERAKEQERKAKTSLVEAKTESTEIKAEETLEQKVAAMENPSATPLLDPKLKAQYEIAQETLKRLHKKAGHGFLAWLSRKIEASDSWGSNTKKGYFGWRKTQIAALYRLQENLQAHSEDDIVKAFRDWQVKEGKKKKPSVKDTEFVEKLDQLSSEYGHGFAAELMRRMGLSNPLYYSIRKSNVGTFKNRKPQMLSIAAKMIQEQKEERSLLPKVEDTNALVEETSLPTPPLRERNDNAGSETGEYLKLAASQVLRYVDKQEIEKAHAKFDEEIAKYNAKIESVHRLKAQATFLTECMAKNENIETASMAKRVFDAVKELGV